MCFFLCLRTLHVLAFLLLFCLVIHFDGDVGGTPVRLDGDGGGLRNNGTQWGWTPPSK